jgi:hypothetical protein
VLLVQYTREYIELIAKVIYGGFAGAEVPKYSSLRLRFGCTLSGVEGKHCRHLQLPLFKMILFEKL